MEWGSLISITSLLLAGGFWLFRRTSTPNLLKQDPYYRLQSITDVQAAASLGFQIDANKAGVDDWLRLPGLSIHQARTLTDLTRSGVPLHCLEDMAAVLGMDVQQLKPLEPILRFCYYDAESMVTIATLNPNTATVEMLVRIPVVDIDLARAIVAHRAQGPYRNLVHLQRRLALPPQLVAELIHYLRFN